MVPRRLGSLICLLCLILAWAALAAETVTVTGLIEEDGDNLVVTFEGGYYYLEGVDLAGQAGLRLTLTGTLRQDEQGQKWLLVTSFRPAG
jgi:hypothetical protein